MDHSDSPVLRGANASKDTAQTRHLFMAYQGFHSADSQHHRAQMGSMPLSSAAIDSLPLLLI